MSQLKFRTPNNRKIIISNEEEAYTYLKNPCKDCVLAYECSGRDAIFCRHIQEMLILTYGYEKDECLTETICQYNQQLSKLDFSKKYESLPVHRRKHCEGVANFLFSYAKAHDWKREDQIQMNLVGMLHDIGYHENLSGKEHGRKGAELLEKVGFSKEFCDLVRYHGKFVDNPSKKQELMWLADLCINGNGEYIGYHKRYDSICKRYHDDPERIAQVSKIIKHLERYYPEYR